MEGMLSDTYSSRKFFRYVIIVLVLCALIITCNTKKLSRRQLRDLVEKAKRSVAAKQKSSSNRYFNHHIRSNSKSLDIARKAEEFKETLKLLKDAGAKEVDSAMLRDAGLENCELDSASYNCDPNARFPTFDGSCNNLEHPDWGTVGSYLVRSQDANYCDGEGSLRCSVNGGELPNARFISNIIHESLMSPEYETSATLMLMQWGQFLDHDIVLTPSAPLSFDVDCCEADNDECLPIILETSDVIYDSVKCIDLVRSWNARCVDAGTGPRAQINEITAYIDGSQVYGSSQEQADDLRSFEKGQLLVYTDVETGDFPLAGGEHCADTPCFIAGDIRINEQFGLTAMHALWVREHNRIAHKLHKMKIKGWNDEIIFMETRRIVTAMMQAITVKEFLPVVLGSAFDPTYPGYNNETNPSIGTEFATASYRFGHSLVASMYNNEYGQDLALHNTYFDPSYLVDYGLETAAKALYGGASEKCDRHITEGVQDRLFQLKGADYGFDLAAINLQRGRDHGIRSYNDYRAMFGLKLATTMDEFDDAISAANIEMLKSAYGDNPGDVDQFAGGLSETPINGGLLGRTFAVSVRFQFEKLRRGDRFWFENVPDNPPPLDHRHPPRWFSPEQLEELHKTSLARIICDNTLITSLPRNVMIKESDSNPVINCSQLPKLQIDIFAPPAPPPPPPGPPPPPPGPPPPGPPPPPRARV